MISLIDYGCTWSDILCFPAAAHLVRGHVRAYPQFAPGIDYDIHIDESTS